MNGVWKPVSWRPEHPNGEKYPFNCCPNPDVRENDDTGVAQCETCGYDWTEVKP